MGRRLTVELAELALRNSGGLVTDAAAQLRVSRRVLCEFMVQHPELEEVRQDATEELLDLAEDWIRKKVERGSDKAIQFVLDRLGGDRGWGRKSSSSVRHTVAVESPTAYLPPIKDERALAAEQPRPALPEPDQELGGVVIDVDVEPAEPELVQLPKPEVEVDQPEAQEPGADTEPERTSPGPCPSCAAPLRPPTPLAIEKAAADSSNEFLQRLAQGSCSHCGFPHTAHSHATLQ